MIVICQLISAFVQLLNGGGEVWKEGRVVYEMGGWKRGWKEEGVDGVLGGWKRGWME